MSGPSHSLTVGLAVVVLVIAVAPGGATGRPAAPASAAASVATPHTPDETTRPQRCFPDSGAPIVVGQEGPRMNLSVHTSLFRGLPGPGGVGISATGATERYQIVTLRAGVVFDGVGDPVGFLADPFSRFRTVFDYTLSLPMLSAAPGPETYEQDDPFVRGPTRTADCDAGESRPAES
ncbi:DUF7332 family protein [Haloplanus ruber]|uniref:Uncharacterized protein n=1 Tax=Haloplanus ruber TaxID=869892 RepID=A0ABD6D0J6_9EURY|nr:hypothetical protein [Haloplanus ruber]